MMKILPNLPPKKEFLVKNRKNKYQHLILHIRISLATKSQLNHNGFFGSNFPKNVASGRKQKM